MTSKEALERLLEMAIDEGLWKSGLVEDLENTIKQDLDKLEKLEKEHNKLKEKYKHRAETSNDLCKAVKQYEKAFEILSDKLELTLYHNKILNTYSIELMCFEEHLGKYITQEEYESLKEVLSNER